MTNDSWPTIFGEDEEDSDKSISWNIHCTEAHEKECDEDTGVRAMVFNAPFKNISVISSYFDTD